MRFEIKEKVKRKGIEELVKEEINSIEDHFNSRLKELSRVKSDAEHQKLVPELYEYAMELDSTFDQAYFDLKNRWEKEIDFKKYDAIVKEIFNNYRNELKKYNPQGKEQK